MKFNRMIFNIISKMNVLNKIKSKSGKASNTQSQLPVQKTTKPNNQEQPSIFHQRGNKEMKESIHHEQNLREQNGRVRKGDTLNSLEKYQEQNSMERLSNRFSDHSSFSETFSYQKVLSREKIKISDVPQIHVDVHNHPKIFELVIHKSFQIGQLYIFEGNATIISIQQILKSLPETQTPEIIKNIEKFIKTATCNSHSIRGVMPKGTDKFIENIKDIVFSETVDKMEITSMENLCKIYGGSVWEVGCNEYIFGKNSLIRLIEKKGANFAISIQK